MNLLLCERAELDPAGRVHLEDRRAVHLVEVLRVQPGQRLRAALWRGPRGSAEVERIDSGRVTVRIELEPEAPPPPNVDLVMALPRPKVLSRVLETAAAFGVRRIDLVNAWRVDKAYFASPRLHPEELVRHARLGCEQGGEPWLPEIAVYRWLLPYLEQELSQRLDRDAIAHRLVAHPEAPTWLEQVSGFGGGERVVVAVGPEGGWIEPELASFEALGFLPVSVSHRVLRVENAVATVLGGLEMVTRMAGANPTRVLTG